MVDFIRSLGKRYWKIINIIRMQAPKWHRTKEKLDVAKTTGTKIMSQTNAIVQYTGVRKTRFSLPMFLWHASNSFALHTDTRNIHMHVYMLKEKSRAFITWIDLLSFRLNLNFQWNIVRICCYNTHTNVLEKRENVCAVSRVCWVTVYSHFVCSSRPVFVRSNGTKHFEKIWF